MVTTKKRLKKEPVWVQVFSTSTSNQLDAHIVEGVLKRAKIPCSLYRNETFNAYPKNTLPTDEIEVMVPSEHFREAIFIVARLRDKKDMSLL